MKKALVIILSFALVLGGTILYRQYQIHTKPFLITFDDQLTTSNLYAPVLKVKATKDGGIELTWNKDKRELLVNEGMAPEYAVRSGYRIYRDGVWLTDINGGTYSYFDTYLYPSESYEYQISTLTFDNKIEGEKSESLDIKANGQVSDLSFDEFSYENILVEGDSIPFGVSVGEANWTNLLRNKLGVKVTNKAVSGLYSSDVVARIERDLEEVNPDTVIISVGTNDLWGASTPIGDVSLADYRNNLINIIQQAKDQNAMPVIVNLHPIECCEVKRTSWNKAIRDISYNEQVPMIDISTVLEEKGGVDLLDDKLHPGIEGHRIIADEIAELFRKIE